MDDARLSPIIEGVETTLILYGRKVRVVVSADTLQQAFGAGSEPSTWLLAFRANSVAIESAARRAQAKSGKDTVFLSALWVMSQEMV